LRVFYIFIERLEERLEGSLNGNGFSRPAAINENRSANQCNRGDGKAKLRVSKLPRVAFPRLPIADRQRSVVDCQPLGTQLRQRLENQSEWKTRSAKLGKLEHLEKCSCSSPSSWPFWGLRPSKLAVSCPT